ncbi:glycosyltransferase [Microbacterium kyungheense]|uniref:Glycosyltransferase involved in cell wall biosynthesis n=1 Tax=Microbacterium kyungheense TaxID=1263636 RepID=A0A543FK25_9MICO|nr:glycosyltransferase [Microbacterium kyungheense]TQM34165.1 glycosyltransferase involved in cell wall biosynthesis [Microbacterium kyungheense]
MSPDAQLPDADYVVLGSRIALGLDGGFAVAVPARLRLLEEAGAREPLMLSVDGQSPEVHAAQRQAFVDGGHVPEVSRMRNLFDELLSGGQRLSRAGSPGGQTPGVAYRTVRDAGGRAVVELPVFENDPEWHLRDANVVVHTAEGDRVLRGFRGLYIAWLDAIADERRAAAGDPDRLFVVVCESRQIGEALVDWDDPRVRLVHTIHNSHLPAPHDDPTAPVTGLWERWLRTLDAYDAVVWPTEAQRDEVAERFGDPGTFHVAPNTIELGDEPRAAASRDPHRVVMLNRLAPQKRVDLAVRAWPAVVAAVPDAQLDVYGDGPLRDELQALVDELGVSASVTLHGATAERDAVFDRSAVFLTSTAFEGQGLSIAEALARGLPVVSTDVRYGPREAVGDAGVLVPPGEIGALSAALIGLLQDDGRRAELSAHARAAAAAFAPDAVRPALVAALRAAVEHPSRRAR